MILIIMIMIIITLSIIIIIIFLNVKERNVLFNDSLNTFLLTVI